MLRDHWDGFRLWLHCLWHLFILDFDPPHQMESVYHPDIGTAYRCTACLWK